MQSTEDDESNLWRKIKHGKCTKFTRFVCPTLEANEQQPPLRVYGRRPFRLPPSTTECVTSSEAVICLIEFTLRSSTRSHLNAVLTSSHLCAEKRTSVTAASSVRATAKMQKPKAYGTLSATGRWIWCPTRMLFRCVKRSALCRLAVVSLQFTYASLSL